MACSEHFLKLSSAKFAPRSGGRVPWKSKIVTNWGSRGGFGGSKCFSCGRCRDFGLCEIDVWSLGCGIRGRVANLMSRKCYFAGIIARGHYRGLYASAQLFRGRRGAFEAYISKSLKRIGILRSNVWSTYHFWRTSRKNGLLLSFKLSFWKDASQKRFVFFSFKALFLEEVSQKRFVFEFRGFIFQESLEEKLRFWVSTFLKEAS